MSGRSEAHNVQVTGEALAEIESCLSDRARDRRATTDSSEWAYFNGFAEGASFVLELLGFYVDAEGDGVRVLPPGIGGDFLTSREAAEEIGLSEQRIRQLLNETPPKLRGRKTGGNWLIERRSVAEYKELRKSQAEV